MSPKPKQVGHVTLNFVCAKYKENMNIRKKNSSHFYLPHVLSYHAQN